MSHSKSPSLVRLRDRSVIYRPNTNGRGSPKLIPSQKTIISQKSFPNLEDSSQCVKKIMLNQTAVMRTEFQKSGLFSQIKQHLEKMQSITLNKRESTNPLHATLSGVLDWIQDNQSRFIVSEKETTRLRHQVNHLMISIEAKDKTIQLFTQQLVTMKQQLKNALNKINQYEKYLNTSSTSTDQKSIQNNTTGDRLNTEASTVTIDRGLKKDMSMIVVGPSNHQKTNSTDIRMKFKTIIDNAFQKNKEISQRRSKLQKEMRLSNTQRDQVFFRLFLDIHVDDKEIMNIFTNNKHFERFLKLVQIDQIDFLQQFMQDQGILTELQIIGQYLFLFVQQLLSNSLKFKKLIRAENKIHSSLVLSDSFRYIVEETCSILECDRASVFLVDKQAQEIWTKSAIGTQSIRISMKEGIAGYVASTGKCLNILDAQEDKRFNAEFDKRNNYKTKTVLCVPILDESNINVIGVIQAINKKTGPSFSKDDEGLVLIMSFMASQVFKNSLHHDNKTNQQNSRRLLVMSGIELNQCRKISQLIVKGENLLTNQFDIPEAKIFIYNAQKHNLFRFGPNEDLIEYDIKYGIVGRVLETQDDYFSPNCYQDELYNSLVDINTKMPVLTIPLKSFHRSRTVGVVQVIDRKGIASLTYHTQSAALKSSFQETIHVFMQIFVEVLLLLHESGRIVNDLQFL